MKQFSLIQIYYSLTIISIVDNVQKYMICTSYSIVAKTKSMCLITIVINILHVLCMKYKNNFHVGIQNIVFEYNVSNYLVI